MARTTRNRPRYLRFTRARWIADDVQREISCALRNGFVWARLPAGERKAQHKANMEAYVARYHAWVANGHQGARPYPPFAPPKRDRLSAHDTDALAEHLDLEAKRSAREWNRMHRDGGPLRVHRPDKSVHDRKTLRRRANAQASAMAREPDLWFDADWKGFDSEATTFPDWW